MSVAHKTSILDESKKKAKSALRRREGVNFLSALKEELKKVSWTSKDELIVCTKVVVGSTVAFGFGIYVIDLLIRNALQGMHHLARWIFGA